MKAFIKLLILLSITNCVEISAKNVCSDILSLKPNLKSSLDTLNNDSKKIITQADKALKLAVFTVMNKSGIAASGNRHDYYTLAPYFWPDLSKKDSLPYIRKDGEVNPQTRTTYTDYDEWNNFGNAISALYNGYKVSKQTAYAKKAQSLIAAWFIDTKTKMNPNLDYAQGVRGLNNGRQFGIIEFSGLASILECLNYFENNKVLSTEIKTGFNGWLTQYAYWLQNSDFGKKESNTNNNHATTYDLQLANILIYLNQTDNLKKLLEEVKTKRIAKQIDRDGKQPEELARTKAFSYSILNLNGLSKLAIIGKKYGVDLWSYESPKGGSIKKAYDFLIPYLGKEWPYEQIAALDSSRDKLKKMLAEVGKEFNESKYLEIANKFQKNH